MCSRGPYKRYTVDSNVDFPRRTKYRRRKQLCKEMDDQTRPDSNGAASSDILVQHNDREEDPSSHEANNNSDDPFQISESGNQEVENPDINISDPDDDEDGDNDNDNDDDDDEDHEILNIENGNQAIYPGALVTCAQSILIMVAFLLKNNLTDVALTDLLDILSLFLPNTFPPSKYKFYKAIQVEDSQVHFYCASCLSYMGTSKETRYCDECSTTFNHDQSMKNGTFFLHIPLKEQLKQLLSDPKLYKCLTKRNLEALTQSSVISDVTTAKLYRSLIQNHGMSGNDFTLTWNADGIPVFKSSQYSIWPIQCMINELPPHLRSSNILLTGLWFGPTKPKMNTFLEAFVNECKDLEENGFCLSDEPIPRKVFALICSSDTPARAMLRNCKQFNGKFGCDWCEHEGVPVVRNKGPPTRYYPQRGPQALRTSQSQAAYAMEAEIQEEPVKGVKGVSLIDVLPTFDTVNGFTPEYMHSVCQGVVRQLSNLWLDSTNHEKEFYLGRKSDVLDERLAGISPPSEITRAPRSVKERKFWKASEWRAFLLYGLVVLNGLLPRIYLEHFFLLVHGVYTLLRDDIADDMLLRAKAGLVKFATDMESLYGLSSCTFNVHLMTHLADGVENCGPLWATSAFAFEANNHMLLKMFNGTQYVPQQICDTFILSQKLPAIGRECIRDDTCPRVTHLFKKLSKDKIPKQSEHVLTRTVTGLGNGRSVRLTASETVSLALMIDQDVVNRSATVYNRFVVDHVLYTAQSYVRSQRHHDYLVHIDSSTTKYGIIVGLYSVKPDCQCNNANLQACQCKLYFVVMVKKLLCEGRSLFSNNECGVTSYFLKEYVDSHQIVAIKPEQLQAKCIHLKLRNRNFICEMPCRFYGD